MPEKSILAVIGMACRSGASRDSRVRGKRGKGRNRFQRRVCGNGRSRPKMQAELKQSAMDGNVALGGPNCAGLIGVHPKVIGYLQLGHGPRASLTDGPVSFVAQSGALGTYMFAAAQDAGVGFDYWVSTGNEAVISFSDFVSYFVKQDSTRTIIAYMEDARDGEGFKKCAIEALEAGKPLIILKVGESEAGIEGSSPPIQARSPARTRFTVPCSIRRE